MSFSSILPFKFLGTIEWETVPDFSEKLPDFGIEYAKTNRDLCVGCDQRIQKSEIRIMKVVHSTPYTTFDGKATWYHVLCFARLRHDLNWLQSAESLPGFRRLFEEDKETIKNYIPWVQSQLTEKRFHDENENVSFVFHVRLIKRAVIPAENRSSSDLALLQKQIKTQNDEYYTVHDQLLEYMWDEDQNEILNANLQMIPEIKSQVSNILHPNESKQTFDGKIGFI